MEKPTADRKSRAVEGQAVREILQECYEYLNTRLAVEIKLIDDQIADLNAYGPAE